MPLVTIMDVYPDKKCKLSRQMGWKQWQILRFLTGGAQYFIYDLKNDKKNAL